LQTTNVVPSLSVSETMNYSLGIKTKRDSLHILSLQASCEDSTDSQSLPLGADFPRTFSEKPDIITLFITPKDLSVISLKDSIMKNKLPGISAWVALRDWVGKNIKYEHDSLIHGVADYWQFAKETISSRTGDCEDHAILLVSLLRASGYSQDEVYVVVGKNANGYHAWVRINLGVIGWYNLEPQESGWATLVGDFLTLSGYQAAYQFNDYYFQKVTQ
jgi:transglutaminase-like putative cysteine protease